MRWSSYEIDVLTTFRTVVQLHISCVSWAEDAYANIQSNIQKDLDIEYFLHVPYFMNCILCEIRWYSFILYTLVWRDTEHMNNFYGRCRPIRGSEVSKVTVRQTLVILSTAGWRSIVFYHPYWLLSKEWKPRMNTTGERIPYYWRWSIAMKKKRETTERIGSQSVINPNESVPKKSSQRNRFESNKLKRLTSRRSDLSFHPSHSICLHVFSTKRLQHDRRQMQSHLKAKSKKTQLAQTTAVSSVSQVRSS